MSKLPVVAVCAALSLAACGGGTSTAAPASAGSVSSLAAAAAPLVTLTAPADGTSVPQCAEFTGTANLPETQTLVLSMTNLDDDDPMRYFETVNDWQTPGALKTWKGYQWFGSEDSSVGQHYQVEVLVVDLTVVKAAEASDEWYAADNPPSASVVARRTLTRIAGPGPAACS